MILVAVIWNLEITVRCDEILAKNESSYLQRFNKGFIEQTIRQTDQISTKNFLPHKQIVPETRGFNRCSVDSLWNQLWKSQLLTSSYFRKTRLIQTHFVNSSQNVYVIYCLFYTDCR